MRNFRHRHHIKRNGHSSNASWREDKPKSPLFKLASEQLPGDEFWTPEELVELFGKDVLLPPGETTAHNRPVPMSKTGIINMRLSQATLALARGQEVDGVMTPEFAKEVLSLPELERRERIWAKYKEQAKQYRPSPIGTAAPLLSIS